MAIVVGLFAGNFVHSFNSIDDNQAHSTNKQFSYAFLIMLGFRVDAVSQQRQPFCSIS